MPKVLIASAIDGISQILARDLHGCDVQACCTGPDALQTINRFRPDLLVIDLMLPGMDGLSVLRRSSFQPPTIIALSSIATISILQAAADLGICEVILIPCSVAYLKDVILKYL